MFPGELIPLTVPEVRRLLCRLLWLPRGSPTLTIQWSGWRRRHQARAMQCHYRRRFLGPFHRMRDCNIKGDLVVTSSCTQIDARSRAKLSAPTWIGQVEAPLAGKRREGRWFSPARGS